MKHTQTFAEMVDEAIARAKSDAGGFEPSRAQIEHRLADVVQYCLDLGSSTSYQFILRSFRGAGTYDALAVKMYKDAAFDMNAAPMAQFKAERNDYGNVHIYEYRWSDYSRGHMWHMVALRQYNWQTGKVT